jgi:hypothetical protein
MAVGFAIGHIKICDESATTGPQRALRVVFALKIERRSRPEGVLRRNNIALIRFA